MDTPTTTTPTTTTLRFRDERRKIDTVLPLGVLAFGILDDGELNYVSDPNAGAPSSDDIIKLVRAMPNHCISSAIVETKLGTELRVQIVYGDGPQIAVVVHLHGDSCAKSTARFARRLMVRIEKRS